MTMEKEGKKLYSIALRKILTQTLTHVERSLYEFNTIVVNYSKLNINYTFSAT